MTHNRLDDFEDALNSALKNRGYPRPLIGDLDDLLCDIERLGGHLRDLLSLGPSFESSKTRGQLVTVFAEVEHLADTVADVQKQLETALEFDNRGDS